ncbi:glycosyltransferase family 2 protein [Brevundimonas sp.]|uniref:glycosyltransferase family 2 protein n=1 Tax=Brevundimonas sp. TaxID=1871086 RepID=UPI002D70329C|nr:glycosyltransferase [Brevundimonas sp.]HYC67396.1 glycosyltransferase [Brevundimonas sp.]
MPARRLVSVIIPTRNRAGMLPRAVGSVRAQTHRELEIIIVDDASTDDTPDVVAAMAAEDPRIRSLRNPEALQNAARNIGMEAARGEVLAFLDDDDYWAPQKLERQLPSLGAYSLVGCLAGRNALADEAVFTGPPVVVPQTLEDIYWDNRGFSPSKFICFREQLQAIGGFDPDLPGATGIDLTANMIARWGPACYLAENLVVQFTQHGQPRISGSARWLVGCERELEKNRALRTEAQLHVRRAQIEIMKLRLARSPGARLKHACGALREFRPSAARRHLRVYRNYVAGLLWR